MENSKKLAPGTGVAGQPTTKERDDYDASWLMKILENGFPKGGIKDTPPFIFSHHAQFEQIGRNLTDPSRDGGLTQALARDIAVVLLAKRFPGLAAVAAPLVDTALKAIEVKPAPQAGAQEPQAEKRKMQAKRQPVRQEKPGPVVRKKGRGL